MKDHGFTFIELIIIIAITSTIAGIAFHNFYTYKMHRDFEQEYGFKLPDDAEITGGTTIEELYYTYRHSATESDHKEPRKTKQVLDVLADIECDVSLDETYMSCTSLLGYFDRQPLILQLECIAGIDGYVCSPK